MRTIRQLFCAARGGHRWETAEDPHGGVTTCSRCGKLRHARGGGGVPGDHGHTQGDSGGGGT